MTRMKQKEIYRHMNTNPIDTEDKGHITTEPVSIPGSAAFQANMLVAMSQPG